MRFNQGNDYAFVAIKLLNEVIDESTVSLMHSNNVLSLPDAMFRRGLQYQVQAEQADDIEDEMMFWDSAFYYQLIAYRAILQRESYMPGRYGDDYVKDNIKKALNEVVYKTHFDEISSHYEITMLSLPQLIRDLINKKDVYLRFELKGDDEDENNLPKLILKMFSKVDDKPLTMCICVPECWYCDFVEELELQITDINSFTSEKDDVVDFDEIRGRDLFLDGEYKGTIDAQMVFCPETYLCFDDDDDDSDDDLDSDDDDVEIYLDDNQQ